MAHKLLLLSLIQISIHLTSSLQLKNITEQVFGQDVNLLPVAFGDFNSDKLTDLFVINEDRTKISILLAQEETFSSVLTSHTYFISPSKVDKKKLKLECTLNNAVIHALIPGDFVGDGGMDVFVLIKSDDSEEENMVMP